MHWTAKPIKHKGENRIAVYFEKNTELIANIKKIDGARWSQSLVAWHLPDTEENRERFKITPIAHSLPSSEGIVQIEKPACRQAGSNNGYTPNAIAKAPSLHIAKL
ncbi:hypothetical protein [Flavobacterium undicola]|uniref:hypothetical protein n=1 Tax=Flavobacterium undicola TaxID=1932779 RepID=UPI0015E1D913|nr:hypothetical protein [Flavobacterium undicola]MBA0885161.1 hypothetical protein [Flavobacterium undicola]